jgi:hypothetical protein
MVFMMATEIVVFRAYTEEIDLWVPTGYKEAFGLYLVMMD